MSATDDSYNASSPAATARRPRSGVIVSPHFWTFAILPESVGIIGLGAIGGSVAWRARQAGVHRIVGYARSTGDMIEALKRGAITEAADNPERAIRGVAFVVLATPPAPARDLLGRMRPWLAEGAIVTDVASVKAPIMQAATAGGLADRFAGSHPLAGTHESGFDAATPTLLQRAVVYVCPSGTDAGDVIARAVAGFWRTVADAEPVVIDAVAHDNQLAWTSHLPQAVASVLASALATRSLGGVSYGPGARDTTRLAASDAGLWVDILLDNAEPVTTALEATGAELERLRTLIRARDARGLRAFLERAAEFRKGIAR